MQREGAGPATARGVYLRTEKRAEETGKRGRVPEREGEEVEARPPFSGRSVTS